MSSAKKYVDYEKYKAPWEVDKDGKDIPVDNQEIDRDRLKRHIFNILKDKENLQEKVTKVEGERDDWKSKHDAIARKDEDETARLKRENDEMKEKLQKGTQESAELRALRLEIALEKGLSKTEAARLHGTTRDELETDADAYLEDLKSRGGVKSDDEGDEEGTGVSQRPKTKLRNHGDPKETKVDKEITLADFPRI